MTTEEYLDSLLRGVTGEQPQQKTIITDIEAPEPEMVSKPFEVTQNLSQEQASSARLSDFVSELYSGSREEETQPYTTSAGGEYTESAPEPYKAPVVGAYTESVVAPYTTSAVGGYTESAPEPYKASVVGAYTESAVEPYATSAVGEYTESASEQYTSPAAEEYK